MVAAARNLMVMNQLLEQRPWLSERYVRRLVNERRIPFHKVGGKLLFDLNDVDRLAEEGRVEPAS
jgi:excisionase family DNA binding protein